jgi:hypothetical protein
VIDTFALKDRVDIPHCAVDFAQRGSGHVAYLRTILDWVMIDLVDRGKFEHI